MLPLRGIVSTQFPETTIIPPSYHVTKTNLPKLTRTVAQWASPQPLPLNAAEDIEIHAQDLCLCIL